MFILCSWLASCVGFAFFGEQIFLVSIIKRGSLYVVEYITGQYRDRLLKYLKQTVILFLCVIMLFIFLNRWNFLLFLAALAILSMTVILYFLAKRLLTVLNEKL